MAETPAVRPTVEWPSDLVATAEVWLAETDAVASLLDADTIVAPALQVALANQRQATERFESALAAFQRRPR